MVTMSQKELQRVKVIANAAGGRLSVREASRLLHLSERQVQRLKRRYQPDSPDWVHHGNRGRSMPWAVTPPQKQLLLTLARGKYQGFNDSHLTEKLGAEEGLSLSRETVRRILRAAQLASPQKRRPRKYRSRRTPRPRFGKVTLTDASRHDWLQGRGPTLTLIGFQDDATGQILAAHFQLEAENTVGCLRALHAMITAHGVPQPLPRSPLHLSAQRLPLDTRRTTRRKTNFHPTRLCPGGTRHPANPRLLSPSQRPHRTCLAHLPRPAGQRTPPRPCSHVATGQRRACPLLRRLQLALRPSRCRFRARLPLLAAPLRPCPLPQPALPASRLRRSHRHLGRPVHRLATLARSSRLRWRNRRTLASTRWRVARLSRRHLA